MQPRDAELHNAVQHQRHVAVAVQQHRHVVTLRAVKNNFHRRINQVPPHFRAEHHRVLLAPIIGKLDDVDAGFDGIFHAIGGPFGKLLKHAAIFLRLGGHVEQGHFRARQAVMLVKKLGQFKHAPRVTKHRFVLLVITQGVLHRQIQHLIAGRADHCRRGRIIRLEREILIQIHNARVILGAAKRKTRQHAGDDVGVHQIAKSIDAAVTRGHFFAHRDVPAGKKIERHAIRPFAGKRRHDPFS